MTPKKTCIFRGFGAQKTISSYSFDQIVLIFGYIVDAPILKSLESFFCKQKTAYDISACLVGSEMCIRDRV